MSHIYREFHEIPIPPDAHINHSDGRVFLMSDDGTGTMRRQVIGIAASDETMHPNSLFKFLFPELWKQYFGEDNLPEHQLHVGMYAASLGIGYSCGLYPVLHDVYGPLYGNAVMDYCMYSIMKRTDTTQLYYDSMVNQVKFSDVTYEDGWFSDMFRNHMSANANHQFRIQWLKQCAARGTSKAWICIDGSNNDIALTDSCIAEKGKAKSGKNSDLVSFIWAVSAEDGTPLTYFVNNGGMADSKAFQVIISFLKSAGIEIAGVILDKGFCGYDTVKTIKELGYSYVLILKSNTSAYQQMLSEHSEDIRWKVEHVINDMGVFGITQKCRLFEKHDETATVGLFFDGINSGERSTKLIRKIISAKKKAEKDILEGNEPSVPHELSAFFTIQKKENTWSVSCNYNVWQKEIDGKGFYAIATSAEMDAQTLYRTYYLRDASEKQFMIMKSQLGFDTTRVHSDKSVESKFAVCFAASIIRSEIMKACRKLEEDTNRAILRLNRINLILMVDGIYKSVNTITAEQQSLLKKFGIKPDHFSQFADDVNKRMNNPINSQIHIMPSDTKEKKKAGRPPKEKSPEENKPKGKPGRPKGSKNKKTIQKEMEAAVQNEEKQKRSPGRPKGSKNKKKTNVKTTPVKRGPGRPKGSKNKPKPAIEKKNTKRKKDVKME